MFFMNVSFHSEVINQIGKCTFGIYLIHDNPLVRELIWKRVSPNYVYVNSPWIHAAAKIAIVFCVSLIIEMIRQKTIGKWFDSWFMGSCDKWWNAVKNETYRGKMCKRQTK